ncbi:MAG: hypothetical protein E6R10_08025 [Rhodocyclaceae bacterium]|jgi:hypothetical protein|nr:MAG: hypothetical protein E6R10_08025 [Rhodocyclaceae bacterium]
MRPIILQATLLAAVALSACGTRGNLTQLPGPHQPPILDRWAGSKPAPAQDKPAEAQGAGDLNTAPDAPK